MQRASITIEKEFEEYEDAVKWVMPLMVHDTHVARCEVQITEEIDFDDIYEGQEEGQEELNRDGWSPEAIEALGNHSLTIDEHENSLIR